jgi:hypothetical protein
MARWEPGTSYMLCVAAMWSITVRARLVAFRFPAEHVLQSGSEYHIPYPVCCAGVPGQDWHPTFTQCMVSVW